MAETTNSSAGIRTRFLIISDTHGLDTLPDSILQQQADVAIHCGDLTAQSELDEFKASIRLLRALNAPLKLVIAGNHDFTMDIPVFKKRIEEAPRPADPKVIESIFGRYGEARELFDAESGITFLDEGTHAFRLRNGALLKVYANPRTPAYGDRGFQYPAAEGYDYVFDDVDVAITHGPPQGVMDLNRAGELTGSPDLFTAVAKARPRMNCFGHIHEGWGAKFVTWRQKVSKEPSHLTDIDDEKSVLLSDLSSVKEKMGLDFKGCVTTSHCTGDAHPLKWGSQTLFVNAATKGWPDFPVQPPWIVDLELPLAP
jgi:hypothetical protein